MLRNALAEQYHAGLAMLRECIDKCPDNLWTSGEYPRYFWRIALHTAFFTQIYLGQDEAAYQPWPERPRGLHEEMWQNYGAFEPYELPDGAEPLTRAEVIAYIDFLDGMVAPTVEGLDLESPESGFRWYANFGKLSHQLMNLRHIQGHVGQLSELLMARGIDIDWIGKGSGGSWAEWEDANP
jgi:hypothetical protein